MPGPWSVVESGGWLIFGVEFIGDTRRAIGEQKIRLGDSYSINSDHNNRFQRLTRQGPYPDFRWSWVWVSVVDFTVGF